MVANSVFADMLKFVQVTDVHFPKKDFMTYENRKLDCAQENFNKFIQAVNSLEDIEYVFFTGDNVDQAFESVFDDFLENAQNINKKFYLCLGNHDVNTPSGLDKNATLKYLKEKMPYNHSGANYFVNLNSDFVAVFLDGTHDTKMCSNGHYSKNTIQWLEKVLSENTDKNILIFQHFPLVEPADEKWYINSHKTRHKRNYIKLLKKYPNVVLISSGHYHVAGEFEKYGVFHYSTPALFLSPAYYRVTEIEYEGNTIKNIKTELIEL